MGRPNRYQWSRCVLAVAFPGFLFVGCGDDFAGADDVGEPTSAQPSSLNGQIYWDPPSDSCDPYKTDISNGMQVAFNALFSPAMQDCLRQTIISYDDSFPEWIIDRMKENMHTEIECRNLPPNVLGVSNTFLNHEYLELNKSWLNGSLASMGVPDPTPARIAGVILHEVAHSKHYAHPNDDQQPFEYSYTVPVQLSACAQSIAAGAVPPKGNGPRRDSFAQETTLAPTGWGDGSGFILGCQPGQLAMGVHARTDDVGHNGVYKVGQSCRVPGQGGRNDTAWVGGDFGTEHHIDCAAGEVMVGLRGRADNNANRAIGPMCASASSVVAGSLAWHASPGAQSVYGDTLGLAYQRQCPRFMAVRALKGKTEDARVKRIEVECQRVDKLETIETSWLSKAGGTGGALTVEHCPGRGALVGVTYHAGSRIDRLGGKCADVTTTCVGSTCRDDVASDPKTFYQMPAHGGTGGAAGSLTCGTGRVMVGMQIQAQTGIDAVGAVCTDASAWSDRTGPSCTVGNGCLNPTVLRGGSGGELHTYLCDRGQYLYGWLIGHATLVDSIQPLCRNFHRVD